MVSGLPCACMRQTGAPAPATTSAIAGSCSMADTSLTIDAPAESAARATPALRVSIEIGPMPSRESASITGSTRAVSASAGTSRAPGRVDSPPMSMIPAPATRMARACSMARSGARWRPPSEKLSGVTLRIPMIRAPGRMRSMPATGARGAVSASRTSPGRASAAMISPARPRARRSSRSTCANQSGPPASASVPSGRGRPHCTSGR